LFALLPLSDLLKEHSDTLFDDPKTLANRCIGHVALVVREEALEKSRTAGARALIKRYKATSREAMVPVNLDMIGEYLSRARRG
jgi:hypothetical protein